MLQRSKDLEHDLRSRADELPVAEDHAPFKLDLTRDQALLLYRAALAGLKGSQPVPQDPETAHGTLEALNALALRLMKDTHDA